MLKLFKCTQCCTTNCIQLNKSNTWFRKKILTYINVKIGDQLSGNINTSLFNSTGGKVCITVPTAADRVGVRSSWGCVLDTGGGHNTH